MLTDMLQLQVRQQTYDQHYPLGRAEASFNMIAQNAPTASQKFRISNAKVTQS